MKKTFIQTIKQLGLSNSQRRGFHKANVALANKNARVVW